jgi:hypothetical protein
VHISKKFEHDEETKNEIFNGMMRNGNLSVLTEFAVQVYCIQYHVTPEKGEEEESIKWQPLLGHYSDTQTNDELETASYPQRRYFLCAVPFIFFRVQLRLFLQTTKLRGLSPRANYTDRETAACRRSQCQRLRV